MSNVNATFISSRATGMFWRNGQLALEIPLQKGRTPEAEQTISPGDPGQGAPAVWPMWQARARECRSPTPGPHDSVDLRLLHAQSVLSHPVIMAAREVHFPSLEKFKPAYDFASKNE